MKGKRHYSGNDSKWFWDRVNRLPRNEGGSECYSLGCALQDLEGRVMNTLENYEPSYRPSPRRRRAERKSK